MLWVLLPRQGEPPSDGLAPAAPNPFMTDARPNTMDGVWVMNVRSRQLTAAAPLQMQICPAKSPRLSVLRNRRNINRAPPSSPNSPPDNR